MSLKKIAVILGLTASLLNNSFSSESATADTVDGWINLFNGTDLTGWEGDSGIWKVEDGYILGDGACTDHNGYKSYLINRDFIFKDFILEAEFNMSGGNSGIDYRCHDYDNDENKLWEVSGYQHDIAGGGLWDIYTTSNSSRYSVQGASGCSAQWADWNTMRIEADGRNLSHYFNGDKCLDYVDNDETGFREEGFIALEFHDNGTVVKFRNIRVKVLNAPPAVTSQPEATEVVEGADAEFTIVSSDETVTYMWQKDGQDIGESNNDTLSLTTVSHSDSGAEYRCIITNDNGSDTSDAAILNVTKTVGINHQTDKTKYKQISVQLTDRTINFSNMNSSGQDSFSMFDLQNRLVLKSKIKGSSLNIPANVPGGVYLWSVKSGRGTFSGKLTVF